MKTGFHIADCRRDSPHRPFVLVGPFRSFVMQETELSPTALLPAGEILDRDVGANEHRAVGRFKVAAVENRDRAQRHLFGVAAQWPPRALDPGLDKREFRVAAPPVQHWPAFDLIVCSDHSKREFGLRPILPGADQAQLYRARDRR